MQKRQLPGSKNRAGMTINQTPRAWVVDSSAALRAILGHSEAAKSWFNAAKNRGDYLIISRFGELEIVRTTKRLGFPISDAHLFLAGFDVATVDDALLLEAAAIPFKLSGADSVHIATALEYGNSVVGLVTHDREMAEAAKNLGFTVLDPVTEDPNGSVA